MSKLVTIFNNYNLENYEEIARENIFENDVDGAYNTPDEIPEDVVCEEAYFFETMYYEDAYEELKNFFEYQTVIVFGTCGRWNGNFAGGAVGDFEEIYEKITRDCDYFNIYDEGGHLYIKCSHHDGTNLFEVKILTEVGYERFNNWNNNWNTNETEEELHNKLVNNSHYTHLPHFAKRVYG